VRTCATLEELNRLPPGPKVVLATSGSLQVSAALLLLLLMTFCPSVCLGTGQQDGPDGLSQGQSRSRGFELRGVDVAEPGWHVGSRD